MKNLLTLFVFGMFPLFLFGQIPHEFNYQAVVRDVDGNIQFDSIVDFKIEILQNGTAVCSEDHLDKNTGKLGVVNFKVGSQNPSCFSQIDWSSGQFEIKVSIDSISMGEADIVAVPFALYAQNSGDNHWIKTDTSLYYLDKKIGIGTASPAEQLEVAGNMRISSDDNYKLEFWKTSSNSDNLIRSFDQDSTQMWSLNLGDWDEGNNFVIDRPGNGKYDFVIDADGKVGIGLAPTPNIDKPLAPLDLRGWQRISKPGGGSELLQLRSTTTNHDSWITSYDNQDSLKWILNLLDRQGGMVDAFSIYNGRLGKDVFWINDNSETTHVRVLEIHGGGDGAEYFNINEPDKLEPGSLVIIDEENEGKLKISSKPYDARIAGVISGAGGVKPGITLEQEEVLEGDELVSLWGRVYVKATTKNGKIIPGDCLTTSNLEGHAMKATKKKKSRGAIIGKALSNLDEGEGLVLILIQPQ